MLRRPWPSEHTPRAAHPHRTPCGRGVGVLCGFLLDVSYLFPPTPCGSSSRLRRLCPSPYLSRKPSAAFPFHTPPPDPTRELTPPSAASASSLTSRMHSPLLLLRCFIAVVSDVFLNPSVLISLRFVSLLQTPPRRELTPPSAAFSHEISLQAMFLLCRLPATSRTVSFVVHFCTAVLYSGLHASHHQSFAR